MPLGAMADVHAALCHAGRPHGLGNYGSFAMNVMRMEKGFKGAAELTNEVTLAEAGLLRFASPDKDFLGRQAALDAGPPRWHCAYLEIEPDGVVDGHGGEAVLRGGEVVGATSSMAYGHSVGRILGFAYVRPGAERPRADAMAVRT